MHMHRRNTSLLLAMVFGLSVAQLQPAFAGGNTPGKDILVSTEWLQKHLHDPNLVILHIAFSKSEYAAGRIPGARLVPWQSIVTPTPQAGSGGLTSEVPSAAHLDSVMESVGVSDQSRIVIYGPVVAAARLFWTIEYLGFNGPLSILDGGLDAWREEKRPLTTAAPAVPSGSFQPRPREDVVVDADWIHARLNDRRMRLVDARFPYFYAGADSGGMARAGHLPGAINLPFNTLTKELSKYRDAKTMKQLFEGAGMNEGEQVVTYCHVGQTASVVYVAARVLGYDARIYDGSFQDWAKRSELPVETQAISPPK